MGGRGTFAAGKNVAYRYKTVGMIDGVKVLQPTDNRKSLKLPEESHTAGNRYILLNKKGIFHQYREYDKNHKVILEIGYHLESGLGEGNVLHIHIYHRAGVEFHEDSKTTEKRKLTRAEYAKYKKFLKGVEINEREYFDGVYG